MGSSPARDKNEKGIKATQIKIDNVHKLCQGLLQRSYVKGYFTVARSTKAMYCGPWIIGK